MKRTYEPREFTNRLLEILAEDGQDSNVVVALLSYMSDDDVRDFAESEGYWEPDEYDD